MKITQTTSFWVIVISAVLGLLVGQLHWILGVIFFFMLAGRSLYTALIIDTAYGVVEYHNDRVDSRTKKIMESIALLKHGVQGENNKTKTYSDGSVHVGQYKNGKPNGQGTWTFYDGSMYVGQSKDGLMEGQGTMTYPDGRKEACQFKDGKFISQ